MTPQSAKRFTTSGLKIMSPLVDRRVGHALADHLHVGVILAAVVLHERVTRDHTAGIALAAAAIVLIGIGSA